MGASSVSRFTQPFALAAAALVAIAALLDAPPAAACSPAKYSWAGAPFPADGETGVPVDVHPRVLAYGGWDAGPGFVTLSLWRGSDLVPSTTSWAATEPGGTDGESATLSRWFVVAPDAPLAEGVSYTLVAQIEFAEPGREVLRWLFTTGEGPAAAPPPAPFLSALLVDWFVGDSAACEVEGLHAQVTLELDPGPAADAAFWQLLADGTSVGTLYPGTTSVVLRGEPGVPTCVSLVAENEAGATGAPSASCCFTTPSECAGDAAPSWCTDRTWDAPDLGVDCTDPFEDDEPPLDYVEDTGFLGCACTTVGATRGAAGALPFLALALVLGLLPLGVRVRRR